MSSSTLGLDERANEYNVVYAVDLIRKPYSRVRLVTPVGEKSMTVQSEAAACDINQILRRFQNTGQIDHLNSFEGRYDDFVDFPESYQQAMNIVLDAQQSFADLPSNVRDAYANDPYQFFKAVHDPSQQDRLIQLGVLRTRETPPKEPADASKASEGSPLPTAS